MGFFDGLVLAVSYGFGYITNPFVLAPMVALGFVAVSFFAIPFVVVAGGFALVLLWSGFQKACENCNKKVNTVMQEYSQFLKNYSGSIVNAIPYPVRIDQNASTYEVVNGNTRFNLKIYLKSDKMVKLADFVNSLKQMVSTGVNGVKVNVITPTPLNKYIIPLGPVDFASAELTRLVEIRDGHSGETVKVDTGTVMFPLSYLIVSFDINDCDACSIVGGKTANELIDEYASKQGLGFIRKIVFWEIPAVENNMIPDTTTVNVLGWVPDNESLIRIIYGTSAVIDQLYRFCIGKQKKSPAEEALCKAFDPSKICPYGITYNPQVFIDVLRNYGYASPDTIQIAKVASNTLPSRTSMTEIPVANLKQGRIKTVRYIQYVDPNTNKLRVEDLANIKTASITSKNYAIIYSDVPFSLDVKLQLRVNNLGSISGTTGDAEIIIDPNGTVSTVPNVLSPIAGFPKLIVRDVNNNIKVLYLSFCADHIIAWDDNKKAIVVYGPQATALVNNNILKSLAEAVLNNKNISISCKVLDAFIKLALKHGCIQKTEAGYRVTCNVVVGGIAGAGTAGGR